MGVINTDQPDKKTKNKTTKSTPSMILEQLSSSESEEQDINTYCYPDKIVTRVVQSSQCSAGCPVYAAPALVDTYQAGPGHLWGFLPPPGSARPWTLNLCILH